MARSLPIVVVLVAQTALEPSPEWLLGAIAASGFLLAAALAYPKGMGMGDVKLALLLGAMLGRLVAVGLLLGLLFALVPAAVLTARHGTRARKMGLPLAGIHAPIHGYAEQLSEGIDRFVDGLKPGEIWGRANWFVVASDAWRYLPGDDPRTRFAHVTAGNAGETLFVRSERQTLRRLPESGAILFTIAVYREPLSALSVDAITRIAASFDRLVDGEDGRRAAPYYVAALRTYAAARGTQSRARAA